MSWDCRGIRLRTGLVEHNRSLASFSADDTRRVLYGYCHHDHDSNRHDNDNGYRHQEYALLDTQHTVHNDSLQHLAGVQGVDAFDPR